MSPDFKPVSIGRKRSTAKKNESEQSVKPMVTRKQRKLGQENQLPLSKSVQQIIVSSDSSDDESSDNDPFSFVRGKMSKELQRNKDGKTALNKT